jgi:hypothetical protein
MSKLEFRKHQQLESGAWNKVLEVRGKNNIAEFPALVP